MPRLRLIWRALIVLPVLVAGPKLANGLEIDRSEVSIPSAFPADTRAIPARLLVPQGHGPFPAVVVMHDCSGLGPKSSGAPARWSNLLAAQGYVAIMPDSFTPRGLPDGVCTTAVSQAQRVTVGEPVRDRDAYSTLAYLHTLPYVDKAHIGIMGGSHGGSATLIAMAELDPRYALTPIAQAKRAGFAAGIALYPGCGANYGTWRITRQFGDHGPMTGYSGVYQPIAPVLILVGALDNWTPASDCQALADRSVQSGYPVDIKVYPDAWHSFDSGAPVRFVENRNNASSVNGQGATTGGNPAAWADSILQVKSFFSKYLGGPR